MIYLDNAATSFNKPKCVKNAVINAIENLTANPGRSGHVLSQNVAQEIFETREVLKEFLGANKHEVIFTKNCTEALNIAILGTLKFGDHVITSVYEHNSVLRPLEFLKTKGVQVTIIEDDLQNFHQVLQQHIIPNTKLVITTSVSNVTGDVCNLQAVGEVCKKHNIIYLVDGAQGCGHIKIDMEKMNIDMLAFAGHKGLNSLTGVGGLIVKNNLKLLPMMFGGTGTDSENLTQPTYLPEGLECGTVPSISIISLKAGVENLIKNFKIYQKNEEKLSKYLYFSLKNLKFIKIYSKPECCNVVSFNAENVDSMQLANILNERGICVRAGLHCAPLIHKKLGTLKTGAVRVSIDYFNTQEEIDYLVKVLIQINQHKIF